MCPYDCQNLMRLLLTPMQYLLWESNWCQHAQLETSMQRQPKDPLYGVTADMLTGCGEFATLEKQLPFSTPMHRRSAQLALEAFFSLPGTTAPSFGSIKQGVTEMYVHFIDQLCDAIIQHPDTNDQMKSQMFRVLAFDNVNNSTKPLLSTLPSGAPVEDVLQRVYRAEQRQQASTVVAAVQGAM